MSNFPSDFDDDTTLPFVNDNITEIGGEAINALRDAVFAVEQNIGLGAAGTTGSIAARLGVSFFPDGYLKPSVITSLGLVTLPITQDQIAPWAMIPESKLRLDHRTQDLFNYIRDLSGDVNLAIGWISTTGVKLDPHLIGAIYRHTLDQIDVNANVANFLSNKFRVLRDNLQSYNLVRDMNDELLAHQWADGSPFGNIKNVFTNNSSTYPSNYAHTASGIFLNTSRFATIPQTALDLQLFAEFIDGASIFLLGTRIQNLYSNGISRSSRSSTLDLDGYGQHLVPVTPAIAYLKNIGNSSSPFDDINTGDDIIEFKPSTADQTNNSFDAKFALVKIGDIIRINYGTIEVPFVIKEKKYIQNSGNKKYIVRIAGKNHAYAPNATARIDRPLFYNSKYGALSIAGANNAISSTLPSLIVASPRGGEALGNGFSPDQFDESHYLLYLALYPTGFPQDGYTILPPIDVTGNLGVTPGLYTLDSIVEATNNAFRAAGYNYRFVAFPYQGEYGIMLADSYGNAAFSILSAVVTPTGFLDQAATELTFTNNVVDLFPGVGSVGKDPLGFGPFGAAIASPPYMTTYGSAEASQNPTKLFVPLTRNNFYINGVERDRLTLEVGQALDGYGDGYWAAEIVDKQIFPGPSPSGRVQTTYRIPLDLSTSTLKAGKTIVVQSGQGTLIDFGRFIIQSITFGCTPTNYTDITVYDAVHAKGFSPSTTLGVDGYVAVYFNSDSVSFNSETATDFSNVTPFKRHFEVYVQSDSSTFTHERGRFLNSGSSIVVNSVTLYSSTELAKIDIIKISPKLRGYQFGSVNKITLHINNYNSATGVYDGFLASYDGITFTRQGPTSLGKKGEVTRFYDETQIDYIDVVFDINATVINFSNQTLDFQLFPTLSLDDEIMLIGTCQLNDTNNSVTRIRDERQFGNISEKEISTSLYNFMAFPERALHFNGVIRGLDIVSTASETISMRGGVALVNGKFLSMNDEILAVPRIREIFSFVEYQINWFLCIDSVGEFVVVPMLDYDSVFGTPNSPTRLFTALNVVGSNTYNIDAITFSNILNNRKDLTPLYIVSSTVTGTGVGATVSLTYRDIRRFINDQDSCTPVVVTNDNAQGNFQNINTAINWLRFNNPFQNRLGLKGPNTVTGAFNFIGHELHISSEGSGATLGFSSTVDASDFRFTDIPVTAGSTVTLTDTVFDNSPLTIAGGAATTLTDVTLTRSPLTVGASSGTTLLTTTAVSESNITVGGTGGFETAGCPISNSIISVGGLAYIGVFALNMSGDNIGTTIIDSRLTATQVTCVYNYFKKTNVTSTNTVACLLGKWSESNLTISVGGLTTDTTYFENSTITVGGNTFLAGGSYNNCTINVTGISTLLSCVFIDCTIVFTGAVTATNVSFRNCNVTFTSGGTFTNVTIDPSTVTIGATISGTSITIVDSIISISAVQGFALGNDFTFLRNNVTWTGAPVSGFVASNIVNPTNGMMFASLSTATTLKNIRVDSNTFNTSMQSRFSFFALLLTDYTANVLNVSVSGNKFTSTAPADDIRAVISVVSTMITRAVSGFPRFPTMNDVHFNNNVCNYDQLILITGTRDPVNGYMNGAPPVVTNTTISGNTCGTVGYFTAAIGAFDGNNSGSPNSGIIRDKTNKLVIADNYCKLITNLDQEGDYICFRATAYPNNNFYEEVITTIGEASIINNTANWIQVGAGGYSNSTSYSGVNIIGNTVSPANSAFLANFTGHVLQSVTPGNVGIMLRRENNAESLSMSTISENNVVQKYTTAADGYVQNVYYYDAGIVCLNNAKITNNNLFGVINSTSNVYMYIWNQNISLIVGNVFRRGYNSTVTISSPNTRTEPTSGESQYMDNLPCLSYIFTNFGSSNKRSIISNNIFHDQNINSASEVGAGRPSGDTVISNPSGSGIIIKNNVVNQTYFTTGIGTGLGN